MLSGMSQTENRELDLYQTGCVDEERWPTCGLASVYKLPCGRRVCFKWRVGRRW